MVGKGARLYWVAAIAAALGVGASASSSWAACSNPAGEAGHIVYAGNASMMVYCDGTNWVSMSGGTNVSIGGTTNNPAGNDGELQFKSGAGFGSSAGLSWTAGTSTLNATNIEGTLTTAAQPNITSVGTLAGLTVSGAASLGSLGVGSLNASGLVSATSISVTALTVNGVAITGNASGDRIVSGTSGVYSNAAGGYVSLTTGATTWGYLGSSATYLPNLSVGGAVSASIVSAIAVQIVSQTGALTVCNTGNAGTLRYNSPTTTLELCTGKGWQPMGVGMPAGTIAAFASTTCPTGWSEYTAARGRFLRGIDNGAGNDPDGTRGPGGTQADLVGSHTHTLRIGQGGGSGGPTGWSLAANSSYTDATNIMAAGGAETRPKNVAVIFCVFNGTSNGWNNPLSGGGAATPAGSSADVQYNAGGALAADTGNFTYASGVLKAPTVSATTVMAKTVQVGGDGTESCGPANIGMNRRNPTTGRMQVCR